MAPPTVTSLVRGSATYKKKDGTLSIAKDQKSVQWLLLGARDPDKAMTIAVANISSRWRPSVFLFLILITLRSPADTSNCGEGHAEDL
jgi:hypothetical protein